MRAKIVGLFRQMLRMFSFLTKRLFHRIDGRVDWVAAGFICSKVIGRAPLTRHLFLQVAMQVGVGHVVQRSIKHAFATVIQTMTTTTECDRLTQSITFFLPRIAGRYLSHCETPPSKQSISCGCCRELQQHRKFSLDWPQRS
jgi:hypothetical protein